MPTVIVGLKYRPPYEKLETEQQLLDVFSELKEIYSKFNADFRITDKKGNVVKDFKQFLNTIVEEKPAVVLTGSGDVGGLVVKNASLEYDLTPVKALTKYWNLRRDGSCHSCHHVRWEHFSQDDGEWFCENQNPLIWRHCPTYDPKIKDQEGQTARSLKELIEEASK